MVAPLWIKATADQGDSAKTRMAEYNLGKDVIPAISALMVF